MRIDAHRITIEKRAITLINISTITIDLPPVDSEEIGGEQNETDKGRKSFCVLFSLHFETLNYKTHTWTNNHSLKEMNK